MSFWVWEVNFAFFDEVVHLVLILVEEGWDAHNHLVDQDAQRPPINRVVVAVTPQHFRGKILSRATEGVC